MKQHAWRDFLDPEKNRACSIQFFYTKKLFQKTDFIIDSQKKYFYSVKHKTKLQEPRNKKKIPFIQKKTHDTASQIRRENRMKNQMNENYKKKKSILFQIRGNKSEKEDEMK